MKRNLFDSGLDRNAANFAPLSPLPFLSARQPYFRRCRRSFTAAERTHCD